MDDFNPAADRLKQVRDAETLARLRAAAADPGAAEKLAASATNEPDPARVHLGILRRTFPNLPFILRGWPVGLPSLKDLANIATLKAHFSVKKPSQLAQPRVDEALYRKGIEELTRHFSQRR